MAREEFVKILNEYFDINDTYCYHLTRDKQGFSLGTIKLDDFVEFDEETINDMADYITEKMGKERTRSHWHELTPLSFAKVYECSHCGFYAFVNPNEIQSYKYCPRCGAKMEE